jgi:hypothetical protein
MLSHETESAVTKAETPLCSPRQIEFAQALDRYMASYVLAHRRLLQRPRRGDPSGCVGGPGIAGEKANVVRQFVALTVEALEGLASSIEWRRTIPARRDHVTTVSSARSR